MSYTDSNLESLGYDMILGLTQKSVDLKMKQFNYNLTLNPDISFEQGRFEPMVFCNQSTNYLSANETSELIQSADPFLLNDGLTSSNASGSNKTIGDALCAEHFDFAIRATPFTPGYPQANLPQIITFPTNQDARHLWFEVYFAEIEIVQMVRNGSEWSIQTYRQNVNPYDQNPDFWLFHCRIDLDLSASTGVDYNNLPEEQKTLYVSNTEDTFRVTELALDLANDEIPLDDIEVYHNQISSRHLLEVFQSYPQLKKFTQRYWSYVTTHNASNLAATSAPESGDTITPAIVDYRFKAYDDNLPNAQKNLSQEDKANLTALNYLIMDVDHNLPSGLPNITWNWLNKQEDQESDGVIAISSLKCMQYLMPFLDPLRPILSKKPRIALEDNNKDSKTELVVTLQNGNASTFQDWRMDGATDRYNWDSPDVTVHDDDSYKSYATASLNSLAHAYIENNVIKCYAFCSVYLNAKLDEGTTEENINGWIYATNTYTYLRISVDADGTITLENHDDDGEPMEYWENALDVWTNYKGSEWTAMVDKQDDRNIKWNYVRDTLLPTIKRDCDALLSEALASFRNNLIQYFNVANIAVLPGGDTFTFADASFSAGNDLVTKIKYQS